MSLILEALRKSEAERRRGLAPDVAMELPPTPAARPRTLAAWLLPALVVAGLLVLAGWWARHEPVEPASPPAVSEPSEAANVPRIESTPGAPPATTSVPIAEAPPPIMQEPALVATPPPPPAPTPSSATTPAASIAGATPPQSPPRPIQPMPAQPVASIQPPPTRPLPPPASDISNDTSMLPPIKLSMHMWDEAPARRFVILNGQRMAEGDRYGGITVIAIERNGVVVESNGTRARVPLP